jgi:ADP-heptose:LPS heptosyltransferase
LLKPIAEVSNIFLIQKTLKPIEKALLSEYKNIQFLGDQINDFSDTAAIIENMDLIISVDTSLIHLAGAMGKTCYLMLPWVPEWRWLNDRNDSPWYSSMQIFRQPDEDNWKAVINNIKNKILENIE